MHTLSAFHLPLPSWPTPVQPRSSAAERPDDGKLGARDFLRIAAEVGSALAACGLLNWMMA